MLSLCSRGTSGWGVLGLLILLIYFMSSGGGITENVSGNQNQIVSSETREISMFHFTSLSDRLDDQERLQNHHNYFKYLLLAVIMASMFIVMIYKCKNHKKAETRRQRIKDNTDLVELHHDSLEVQGMIKQPMTNRRRREIERRREEQEEEKKNQKEQGKKEKGKNKEQEKEDTPKQKRGIEENSKQKQGQKQKREQEMRWVQIPVGDDDEL